MLDLNLSPKDRAWHLANAKLRLERADGTSKDIDRALVACVRGGQLPEGKLPLFVFDQKECLRFNQSSHDPTLYLQEL